ncbi:MAG: type II toxin-antitoxin system VapC family toxin [Thermodesulfobacteriota bacterium]
MNILLDTHILIWSIFESNKLKNSEIEILLDQRNNIFVSVISIWEISLKYSLGKLKLTETQPDKIPNLIKMAGFQILNLNAEEASGFYKLNRESLSDPFDRMLVIQAIKNNLTLLTKDSKIKEYKAKDFKILEF